MIVKSKRTRKTLEEVFNEYPNGVHVVHVNIYARENGDTCTVSIKEDPDSFFYGGRFLTEDFINLANDYGTLEKLNADFESNPRRLNFKKVEKNGRTYINTYLHI